MINRYLNKNMKNNKILKIVFIFCLTLTVLKVHAQNNDEKLDIAYKYLSSDKTAEAIKIFEEYIKTHPGEMQIYLQLAYAYKQIGEKVSAKEYFFYVSKNSFDNKQINAANDELKEMSEKEDNSKRLTTSGDEDDLNLAYSMINKGNYKSAIEFFEKYKLKHQTNTKISLQLGYLYSKQKRYEKAIDNFEYVNSNSKNTDEIDKSAQSLFYLKDMLINNSKRSINIYFHNLYDSYQDNYISNFIGHVNFKLWKNAFVGPYADVYMDARSKKDKIYNDRYVEGGGFFKYRLTDFMGFELRAGYVNEIDFNKTSFNYKPILDIGTRFGNPLNYLEHKNKKLTYLYFDVFSSGLYDYKFRNLFGQLQLKEVVRNMTGGYSYLEFYLTQMVISDSKKLDYNNYAELGAGLTFKPNLLNFPVLFLEATNKNYFIGQEGKYFTGSLKNTFQIKAGFLLNLKTLL
jgi:Tfp pilus assembly protein PilF